MLIVQSLFHVFHISISFVESNITHVQWQVCAENNMEEVVDKLQKEANDRGKISYCSTCTCPLKRITDAVHYSPWSNYGPLNFFFRPTKRDEIILILSK